MNNSNPMHWSFDYNYGTQNPQFAQELIRALRGYDPETDTRGTQKAQTVTHVYDILPNYWRGYSSGGAKEKLSIGAATIKRSKDGDNLWNYSIQYENTTSGENLEIKFRCGDEDYRPLKGNWSVDARNSGDDKYTRLACEGYLALDSEVRLRISGTEITAGTVDVPTKLTCNWALFDVIPRLSQTIKASSDGVDFTLLEDLEQLRPKSRLGFLASIQTPLPLDGYYLYGTGLLPSYWWLDAYGNIAIASTFFETLVLREKIGDCL